MLQPANVTRQHHQSQRQASSSRNIKDVNLVLEVGYARPCAHIVRIVQDVLIEVLVPDHIVRVPLCHSRQRHQS